MSPPFDLARPVFAAFILAIAGRAATVCAQPVEVVHAFKGPSSIFGRATLALGTDGNFYRTTCTGGPDGAGQVFKVTTAGEATLLYAFTGGADGTCPGRLVHARDGNLYGTTAGSGPGTVFRLTPAGTLTVVHTFVGAPDGKAPLAPLIEATVECTTSPGVCTSLYGTASRGGASDLGTAFRISLDGTFTILHSFSGAPGDGASPSTALVQMASDQAFYGTTQGGGTAGKGTVYRMTASGDVTLLHSFSGARPDGIAPVSPLATDHAGWLYGVTTYHNFFTPNSQSGCRVVFRIAPNVPLTVLPAASECLPRPFPQYTLTMVGEGELFGTSDQLFSSDLFRLQLPAGGALGSARVPDAIGARVESPLIRGTDGHLYGTTGISPTGQGSVFRWRVFPDSPDVVVSVRDGQVRLTWTPIAVATSYRVIRRGPGCATGCESTVATAPTSVVDRPGGRGSYRYVIQAINALGVATSHEVSAHVGRAVPADFDGDGRSDVAIYRPSIRTWAIRQSGTLSQLTVTLGGDAEVPVAEDYDGDGLADVAVFQPASGQWSLRSSENLSTTAVIWGGAGDVPVAADYDGDGRADVAVFRPSTGTWYIRYSAPAPSDAAIVGWGTGTDQPVPADYDGDGNVDVAVFRRSTNQWWIRQSSTRTAVVIEWGAAGEAPVPGDYDADGKADVATFRAEDGTWRIRRSSRQDGRIVSWGGPSDRAVPGDYDGNGFTDVAVFRPSTGVWHIRPLASHLDPEALTWGGAADLPAPGDYDGDGRADVTIFRVPSDEWFVRQSASLTPRVVRLFSLNGAPAPGDYDGDGTTDLAAFSPFGWVIQHSSTGRDVFASWGAASDVPVPGDYDGDGKTDVAVFRPSTNTWFVRNSGSLTSDTFLWGGAGDVAAPGDYDGDGKTDVAVFRPSNRTWFIRYTGNGSGAALVFGDRADRPVPGDYDGDGRADLAVFSPASGLWSIRFSSTNTAASGLWGMPGDMPVPADYDGDGTIDVAVFRPSNGVWYVRGASGVADTPLVWGVPADIPILGRP